MSTLTLKRLSKEDSGIYSLLTFDSSPKTFYTLEHSYNNEPKVGNGTYTCSRSLHRLHGMTDDFETFEVMNVPGHSGILFHWGNFNKDSDGCILLGESRQGDMITSSRQAWQEFMDLLKGQDNVKLIVTD